MTLCKSSCSLFAIGFENNKSDIHETVNEACSHIVLLQFWFKILIIGK